MKSAVQFAIAWLAAWCQVIVVAAMPLGPLVARLDPVGNAPICHVDTDEGQAPPSQPAHDDHRCMLCQVCQSYRVTAILVAPTLAGSNQSIVQLVRYDTAQPRAPPPRPTIAAQPRGPPSLI